MPSDLLARCPDSCTNQGKRTIRHLINESTAQGLLEKDGNTGGYRLLEPGKHYIRQACSARVSLWKFNPRVRADTLLSQGGSISCQHQQWEVIESAVRQLTVQRGELYVITGPLFNGTQLKRINRVLVPSHLLKLVLNGRRNEASAYLRANKDTDNYQRISVTELEQMAGISLLPGVTNKVKAAAMALPESHPYAGRRR